jgi:sulfotransferase family protein
MPIEIVVTGFPKCGTTALMRAFEADPEMDVLRTPEKALEIAWPQIRDLTRPPRQNRILAHKFTAYVYNRDALTYLRDVNSQSRIVLCIRDPQKALISWHNMHRKLATDGRDINHFAWKERDFYAECTLEAYYDRFARTRLYYDRYLAQMLEILPADRVTVLSQESLARNMDNVTTTLKDAARGTLYPIPAAHAAGDAHESFADRAGITLPYNIRNDLAGMQQRLFAMVTDRGLHASL